MVAQFIASAPSADKLPALGVPEFALIGRSNVGKSTLLGALLRQPKLVRTSRTPGRTQALNLFALDERMALVDLPGYGYAKLSKQMRNALDRMVRGYLADREQLAGVIQVLDARREAATELDRDMAGYVLRCERPLLLAVTKSDLIAKTRRLSQLRRIEAAMGVPSGYALLCSGQKGTGLEELRQRLAELTAP